MKKRLFTTALALVLALSLFPAAHAGPIDTADSWARDRINEAIAKGFVPPELQNDYKDVITRAEFCRLAVKWLEYVKGAGIGVLLEKEGLYIDYNTFSDTLDPDILAAYALGITNGEVAPAAGKPGVFNPGGGFTRQQAAVMTMNTCRAYGADVSNPPASDFADINQSASWARQGISFVRANGIMAGTTSVPPYIFNPNGKFTRQESIIVFNNINPAKLPVKTDPVEPPPSLKPVLPGEGGSVRVEGSTEYEFTPSQSGAWSFRTSNNGINDPSLYLYDSQDRILASGDDSGENVNSLIVARLKAGEKYTVVAGFSSGGANDPAGGSGVLRGSYTLTVSPVASVPDSGGELKVYGQVGYAFTPNRSGLWTFRIKNSSAGETGLNLYFPDEMCISDAGGGADRSPVIIVYLKEGLTYYADVRFDTGDNGSCLLSVTPAAPIGNTGGIISVTGASGFSITPGQSGTWKFRTSGSGDSDPYLEIYDANGHVLARGVNESSGTDTTIILQLSAWSQYYIYVGFFNDFNSPGACTLTVSRG